MAFSPATSAVFAGNLGQNGIYVTPVTVRLTATDPDSPGSEVTTFASLNGGNFVPTTAVAITSQGNTTLSYFSRDADGNSEPVKTFTIAIDTVAPTVTAAPNVTSLFPPNRKLAPVTVRGRVSDGAGTLPSRVTYRVVDEYGVVQPSGTARLDANGQYRFTVRLQSSRLGQDKDGRTYTILVTATDRAGNTSTTSRAVTVLHDRGRGNQGNSGNGKNDKAHANPGQNGKGNNGKGHDKIKVKHGSGHGHA